MRPNKNLARHASTLGSCDPVHKPDTMALLADPTEQSIRQNHPRRNFQIIKTNTFYPKEKLVCNVASLNKVVCKNNSREQAGLFGGPTVFD